MPFDPSGEGRARSSRPFIVYAIGQAVSATGMWMQRMAIGWMAWDLTHSVAWVGAMALTELVAALWVGPLAGVMTDRSNPFRLSVATQSCAVVVALALYGASAMGVMTIWLLWLLALADSTWQGLNQPVRMTLVGFLAGREDMGRAVASNSIGFNVARAIGPMLAGIIIVQSDVANVFLVNIVTFIAMMAILIHLRPLTDRPAVASQSSISRDMVDGYRYIARTPTLAAVFLLLLSFSFLGRPFTELFPAIAGQMLDGGPGVLSMLMSAQGVGALVGGVWMLRRHSIPTIARATFLAGFGMAAALIVFTCLEGLRLSLLLIALAGLCHVICNIGMQSLAQLYSAPAFRGRTMALYGLIMRAGPAAGAALIGLGAQWFGLPLLIGVAAALCGMAVVLIGGRSKWLFSHSERPVS